MRNFFFLVSSLLFGCATSLAAPLSANQLQWVRNYTARLADVGVAPKQADATQQVDDKVQFNRDIRPILAENCFLCHGSDSGSRKAGLRLDTEAGFFADRGDGPTIVAGNPEKSPLYQRISAADPEDRMPPPEAHKTLKAEQIALIRRWIVEGAHWQPHWSFLKPEKSTLPRVKDVKWVSNPIDNFVLARLESAGLKPAAPAPRNALARRVALDLTGLPPDPQVLAAFINDRSPNAYEKLVDALMASPRYGEHRARYWLDAARYADTHGMHFDNYREMWPYRDWVIQSFNRNEPFDRFATEQIAGDLLPNPTQDQLVATGFHRANMTTNEGGTIEAENLAMYANDRASTTGWVFSGLTLNCAGCHDHKFDPTTQKDFYAMTAFFRNTTQGALDGNVKDGRGPVMTVVTDPDDRARWEELPMRIRLAKTRMETQRNHAQPQFQAWLSKLKSVDFSVPSEKLVLHAPLNEGNGDQTALQVLAGDNLAPKTISSGANVAWKAGKLGAAPTIDSAHIWNVGDVGDFERDQSWSYGAWIKSPEQTSAVMARMDEGNDFRGWDMWQQGRNIAAHFIHKWPMNALKMATTDNPLRPNEWQHVFVTYDGSGKPEGVQIYVDGKAAKIQVEGEANTLSDTIRNTVPFRIGARSAGSVSEGAQIQDVRVYGRKLDANEVQKLADNSAFAYVLSLPVEKRTSEQTQGLMDNYLRTQDPKFGELSRDVTNLQDERMGLQAKYPITHIQQEKTDSKAMANILIRGAYDHPGEAIEADVPHFLNPLPPGAPHNRLGLAEWIVSPDNPLTARVTVNRFWQELFGTGLVKTSEDFGIMGEAPSDPELLDWLAVDFQRDWDVKRLFKTMVMSSTYRQAAVSTPLKNERDRDNRMFSRGPRFRMDGEMLRDTALEASGLLQLKMGGPGVKPYNPDGLWDITGIPGSDTRKYELSKGDDLYRRSVYSFWKRMSPPANLEIFNAPNREVSCTRRERTNTPLQSLVMMNDPQFVEAARVLAANALAANAAKTGSKHDDETLDFITRHLISRTFTAQERAIVSTSLNEIGANYRAQPDDAKALLGVGASAPDAKIDASVLASWTMIASQVMNLDEALNK